MTLNIILSNGDIECFDEVVQLANTKKWCAENALLTVDGIAMFAGYGVNGEGYAFAVNTNSSENKILVRLKDEMVITSSMSDYSYKRFKSVYKNNVKYLVREIEGVHDCA